jgi:hypothetical protein
MSIAAVSSNLIKQQEASYFQNRGSDLKQLGSALASGNLEQARAAFNSIEALGKSGPFGGKPFKIAEREQDFAAIGKALQSGDLAGAQQAISALSNSFKTPHPASGGGPAVEPNLSNSGSSAAEVASSGGSASGGISVSA